MPPSPRSPRATQSPHLNYLADMAASAGRGRQAPSLGEFYEATAAGDDQDGPQYLSKGEKVWWNGTEGRMMKTPARNLVPMEGNIFDPKKLASVARAVRDTDHPLVFDAGYGEPFLLDRGYIEESIRYADGTYDGDHGYGVQAVYTTGDDDLDTYLRDPRDFLIDQGAQGVAAMEKAKAAMEKRLAAAAKARQGDFGRLMVQVRDGNHRAFGAALGGEPFVWVLMSQNSYQDYRERPVGGDYRAAWRAAVAKVLS